MNRIALLRKSRKMSQKELGTAIGVAQNTVCNWENGNREPDNEALKKMAVFFDCSIDYLLGRDETQEKPIPVAEDGLATKKVLLIQKIIGLDKRELETLIQVVDSVLAKRDK